MKELIKEEIEKDRHRGLINQIKFSAFTDEFGASTREFGANTREFGANTREFGAFTSEFGAFPREFGANTRKFDAFTREFGANTRETQKRTCIFSLLCTMHLEFNEAASFMILLLTDLGSIVKAAKR
jgi:hypothetical protein